MRRFYSAFLGTAGALAACLLAIWFLPAPAPVGASSITSATAGFDPLDSTTLWLREEFGTGIETAASPSDTTGTIGQLGWFALGRGNAGSVVQQVGVWPNNGLHRLTTAATATDDGRGLNFAGSGRQPFNNLGANAGWGTVWIFRIDATTNRRISLGMTQSCAGAQVANLTEGFRVRYDTAQGDTDFMFSVVVGGAESGTPVTSGVAVNTNFNTLLVESTVAGTWRFSLNGGTVKTACASGCDITSSLTTASLTPCAFIVSAGSAGARTMDVDAWFWRNTR